MQDLLHESLPRQYTKIVSLLESEDQACIAGVYRYMMDTIGTTSPGREPNIFYTLLTPIMLKSACDILPSDERNDTVATLNDATLAVLVADELVEGLLEQGKDVDENSCLETTMGALQNIEPLREPLRQSIKAMNEERQYSDEITRREFGRFSENENVLGVSGSLHVLIRAIDQKFNEKTDQELVKGLNMAFRYLTEIGTHGKDRLLLSVEGNTKSPFGNLVNARALMMATEDDGRDVTMEDVQAAEEYYVKEFGRVMQQIDAVEEPSRAIQLLGKFLKQFAFIVMPEKFKDSSILAELNSSIQKYYGAFSKIVEELNSANNIGELNRYGQ